MKRRGNPWVKGVLGALIALAIYVVTLGLFLSLALLVVSMEEGGGNLSGFSFSLACAVFLLSQGVGFEAGFIVLSIIPLLLTGLVIWLIAVIVRHTGTDSKSYLAGLLSWVAISWVLSRNVSVVLLNDGWMLLIKTAIVYTFGFICGALPGSAALNTCKEWTGRHIPDRVQRLIGLCIRPAVLLLCTYFVLGLLTVVIWTVQNHDGMMALFRLSAMQTGSRIVTTVCTLAWLPNLAVWGLSWLLGGGFSIGDVATFTLWSGGASGLPPVPVFGVFPNAVGNANIRTAFLVIPVLFGLAVGLLLMFSKRFFAVHAGKRDMPMSFTDTLLQFVWPLVAFVINGVVLAAASSLMFWISNGSLGRQRLKDVGVDVAESMIAVVKPTVVGLLSAWLVAVVLVALVLTIRAVAKYVRASKTGAGSDGASSATYKDSGGLDDIRRSSGKSVGALSRENERRPDASARL